MKGILARHRRKGCPISPKRWQSYCSRKTTMDTDELEITPLRLGNLKRLAQRLGSSPNRLTEIAENARSYYDPFELEPSPRWFQRNGLAKKPRPIDRTTGELLSLQKQINKELLKPILMPPHIFGAVSRRSIFGNAECHHGANLLVTLDIKQCFPSITPRHIYRVWSSTLGCSPKASSLLTALTTFQRRLPQGAPTSLALANLFIWSIDGPLRNRCNSLGVIYSTWIDDLALSGTGARKLIQFTIELFRDESLKFSRRKTTIMGPNEVKTLTGTRFGDVSIRVPSGYLSQVRAGIHNMTAGKVKPAEFGIYTQHLLGRLQYLSRICPADARPLKDQLSRALPFIPFAYQAEFQEFLRP
jgi:RNA-directed DNA polymerase